MNSHVQQYSANNPTAMWLCVCVCVCGGGGGVRTRFGLYVHVYACAGQYITGIKMGCASHWKYPHNSSLFCIFDASESLILGLLRIYRASGPSELMQQACECFNSDCIAQGNILGFRASRIQYRGLILGLCPANERRRYKVTPSLIG